MIDGAIKRRGIAKKFGIRALQMAHGFDDVDALRRVQNFEENPGAFESQVEQQKIDIVEAAESGFERVAGALLFFQAHTHLAKVALGASALSVAPPIHLL